MWASLGGLGFAAGVFIGGVLTSGPGWRWVFFINVPVGIVLLAAIRSVVPLRRPDRAVGRIDVLGAVTATAATGSLIYGLINAGDEGWSDLETLLPIVVALVLYGVFAVVERARADSPDAPEPAVAPSNRDRCIPDADRLRASSSRTSSSARSILQHLRGLAALETGLFFLPAALGLMIGAIAAGRLVGTIGTSPVAVAGPVLATIP